MWKVVNINDVTPHFSDIGNYLNSMEKAGWTLTHVDQGYMFFKKKSA